MARNCYARQCCLTRRRGGRGNESPVTDVPWWSLIVRFLGAIVVSACLLAIPYGAQGQRGKAASPRRPVISPWDVEAREYLGTPESEAAVNAGLAYLAARQQPDGH